MNMKKSIYSILFTFVAIACTAGFANAQAAKGDPGNISLNAYVPEQIENFPPIAATMLSNKLNQLISTNGVSSGYNDRFIITANLTVASKDLLATAPPMTALTVNVTLYIGDGIDGKKFSSHSVTVKGVGTNETKAYMEAIKLINPNDPGIKSFVADGKSKIIDYYNSRCPIIMKEANALAAQNKFEEAISMLAGVPDASTECYNKAMAAAAPLYQKAIDRRCKTSLAEATNLWNANQNLETANAVGEILTSIDPQSSCYGEVKALSNKVAKKVQEVDKREWNYKFESEIGLKKDLIKAYRDVGVAYGKGQPKSVTYNVRGWW